VKDYRVIWVHFEEIFKHDNMSDYRDIVKKYWQVEEFTFISTFIQPTDKNTGQYQGDFGYFINLTKYDTGEIIDYHKEITVESEDRRISVYIRNVARLKLIDKQLYQISLELNSRLEKDNNPYGISVVNIDIIDQEHTRQHFSSLKKRNSQNRKGNNYHEKNEIELELKSFWNIEKFRFIASVTKSANNVLYLRNIRTENGERLRFPNGKSVTIGIPDGTQFDINEEYIIEAFLAPFSKRDSEENKYLLYLDTKNNLPQKYSLPTKEYVNKLRYQYESAEGIARDTIIGSLRRLTAETNKKPETFIFELIQNADDYPSPNNPDVHVSFNITNDHLVITHNGLPFQQKNVYAICTVDSGDKKDDVNKTGFKGIGFKSIFKFSDHVWINSGGYSFKFDKNYFEKQGKEMPWQVIPVWTEPMNVDEETKSLINNPVSIFIRPTEGNSKLREIAQIFSSVFKNDDRVLLFLRHVRSISFNIATEQFKIERDNNKWAVSNVDSVVIPEEIKERLSQAADKDDRVPEKYKNIGSSKITFATSLKEGKVSKTNDARLYAYLPTDWNFGFDFLINGDFIPDGSRDRLFDDIEWNLYLFEQAGIKFIEWIKELSQKIEGSSSYNILPNLQRLIENEHDRAKIVFLEKFKVGYDTGIETIPFLRSRKNEFKKIEDLVLDKTDCTTIFSDEILSLIFADSKELLHEDLARNQKIDSLFNNYAEDNLFDWDDLKNKINQIEDWLKIPVNNSSFLNFIANKEKIEKFEGIVIVLDQNGELKSFDELYYEIPMDDLKLLSSFLEFPYLNENVKKLLESPDQFPFKSYSVEEFVEDVIWAENSTVDDKIEDFQTSVDFYSYLASHQSELSDALIKKLNWFRFFDRDKINFSSIDGENIYFENEVISLLLNSKCLPKDQLLRLPKEYLYNDDALLLWSRLGVKTLDENNVVTFIQKEICEKATKLNEYFRILFEEDKGLYKIAINIIIQFIEKHIDQLSTKDFEQLGSLDLFLDQDELESFPSGMNLYFEEDRINKLIQAKSLPEGQIYILPRGYLISANSSKFWSKLGVKTLDEDNVVLFIEKEICVKATELDEHFAILVEEDKGLYKIAINIIIQFVEIHIDKLSTKDFEQLGSLDLFLDQDELESYPSGMNLYFEEERINTLIQAKSLPEGQIYILPKGYLISANSSKFWSKLGVKTLDDGEVAQFINEEICEKVTKINAHSNVLNSENVETCLGATKALLEFYFTAKVHLSPNEIETTISKMSEIVVLNTEEGLTTIKEGYISNHYTGKTDIEELLGSFPEVKLSFISNQYTVNSNINVKEWKNTFVELGARNDNIEFIKSALIPHFENITEENIISATKLLFENRKLLEDELQSIEDFPVLTKNENIIVVGDAVLGQHFLQEGIVKRFVEQFEFEKEISSLYTNDKIDKWTEFFQSLGVPKKEDEELIRGAIELLLEDQELFEQEEKHHQLFNSVLELHRNEQLLSSDYEKLQEWKLMCHAKVSTQIYFKKASSILFSNAYNPKIRFENFDLNEELFFLSKKYQHDNSNPIELVEFLKELGVRGSFIYNRISEMKRDNMPSAYVEWIDGYYPTIAAESINYKGSHLISSWVDVPYLFLIVNSAINVAFWELVEENSAFRDVIFNTVKYKKYNSIQNVESEPLWYIREHKTVPNLKGELFRPGELYAQSLRDLIRDNSLVTSIDYESIESNNFKNLAEALNIKTELDFTACLNIIKRQESHNWLKSRNVISKLEDLINEELTDEERNAFDEFKENGNLLSQTLQWVPIANLHTVVSNFKLGITKSHYLLHEDFKNLSKEFEIKGLGAEDFVFAPKEKREDINLSIILKNRAKFLAFLLNENEWEEIHTSLLQEIEKLKFYTCKKISLSYKKGDVVIENSDFDFFNLDGSDDFYFIGRWDRVRAAEMYPQLYKRLDLKHPVSDKVFKDILFAESIEDIFNYFKENNIELPREINPNAREIEPINSTEEIGSYNQENTGEDIHESSIEDSESIGSEPQKDEEKHHSIEGDNQNTTESTDNEGYSEKKEGLLTGRIDLTLEEQIQRHNENVAASRYFLEQEGYDLSETEDLGYKTTNIISPNGDRVDFIFRSAAGGLLHLNSFHWEELDVENTYLLVGFPNEFRMFSSKMELLEEELNSNLLFRIKNSKNIHEVDSLFQSLDDEDGQLILVTSPEMKFKLYEQFKNQKDNKPLTDLANTENLNY